MPWAVARQAPLSMGFSRQEYWSGLPCPRPGDLPDPGMKPFSLVPPALAGRFFTTSTTWEIQSSGQESGKHISWNKPLSSQQQLEFHSHCGLPAFLVILLLFGEAPLWSGSRGDESRNKYRWDLLTSLKHLSPSLRQPTPHIQAPSSLLNAYRINPGRAVLPAPVYLFKSHCFSPASTPLAEFKNH